MLGCVRYYIRLRTESKQNNVCRNFGNIYRNFGKIWIYTEISVKFRFRTKFWQNFVFFRILFRKKTDSDYHISLKTKPKSILKFRIRFVLKKSGFVRALDTTNFTETICLTSIYASLEDAEAIDHAIVSQMQKIGVGVWQCTACGWQTKYKTRLYEHVEAKHIGTGGHACPLCGKFCASLKGLKTHRQKYHSNKSETHYNGRQMCVR